MAIESMSLGNGSGWGWFTADEDTPASNNLGEREWHAAEDARLNAVRAFGEGRDESQHEEPVAPLTVPPASPEGGWTATRWRLDDICFRCLRVWLPQGR